MDRGGDYSSIFAVLVPFPPFFWSCSCLWCFTVTGGVLGGLYGLFWFSKFDFMTSFPFPLMSSFMSMLMLTLMLMVMFRVCLCFMLSPRVCLCSLLFYFLILILASSRHSTPHVTRSWHCVLPGRRDVSISSYRRGADRVEREAVISMALGRGLALARLLCFPLPSPPFWGYGGYLVFSSHIHTHLESICQSIWS